MSIKIDKTLKARAQATAQAMGIPLSTIINAYLRDVVATGHVEFNATERMTPQMERIIGEVEAEIARGEVYGPFDSMKEAVASLHEEAAKLNDED